MSHSRPSRRPAYQVLISWWVGISIALLIFAIAAVLFSNSKSKSTTKKSLGPSSAVPQTALSSAEKQLVGHWLRPDGGYVIEIREAKPDGQLDASYFNPSIVNISRADWKRDESGMQISIELNDVNYPNATYKLRYLADREMLVGEFNQPLAGQPFTVYFVRQPAQP